MEGMWSQRRAGASWSCEQLSLGSWENSPSDSWTQSHSSAWQPRAHGQPSPKQNTFSPSNWTWSAGRACMTALTASPCNQPWAHSPPGRSTSSVSRAGQTAGRTRAWRSSSETRLTSRCRRAGSAGSGDAGNGGND